MASQIRESFKPWSPKNYTEMDNLEFISMQGSSVQSGEDISNSSIAQPNFPPVDSGSRAKQELQILWEWFTSWLQPEQQSKEQMISNLVLRQFVLTGHCKDKFALKQKWESSGRNMRRFMEGLTDECLKPPVMVHVSMHGQEALFSERMTLKEVIKLLKQQQSATTTTQANAGTPLPIPQDMLLATGYENSEDGRSTFLNNPEVKNGVSSPRNEMDSLLIIQTGQYLEPEEGGVSYGVPQDSRRASQGTSRYQAEPLRAPAYKHIPMEVQAVSLSRTAQSEDNGDGRNTFLINTDVNSGISNLKNDMDSLLIIQRGQYPEPKEGGVSYGVLWDPRRAIWGTCESQEMSPTPHSSENIHMGVPGFLSRPEQCTSEPVPLYQNNQANSVCESHQERLHIDLKPYKCEECSRTFKYPCNLSVHQKKHRKERSFVCTHCLKAFYQVSDLRNHEVIHMPEKPFPCSTCGRSFSHKTNLQAHERIHTGEKPYTCSLCYHRFRQSSTYHRHLRNYHKYN
ncbi:zinc finger and SCAN domain containing protein 4C [Peromyscus maniculatus bairdii]|uniref:Uncharacterized protein n=1 Tax=Peromyscus maniculatus bairdii TaxID=230844 RepID=A0A6I9M5C3_PERMB|nr:zinc finger and SCAN domain-containing protein 4 isoform X1 [Peromyscus maniculatus bairdii]